MQLFSVALLGLVIIAASLCAGRTASSSSPLRLDSPSLSSPVAAPPSLQFKRSTAYKEPEHPVQIDRVELALQGGAGQIESAADPGSTTSTSHKRKRCIYIGTFFHVIDCNAPVNSTQIPYAPPRKPEQTTTTTTRNSNQAQVVSTGLVTRTRAKAAAATSAAEAG